MKKTRQSKTEHENNRLPIAMLSAVIIMATFFSEYCQQAVVKTATLSAGLALPQSSAEIIRKNYYGESEPVKPDYGNIIVNDNGTVDTVSASGYNTPKDIVSMAKEAESFFATASHNGVIAERQYDATNATSVYENITVRNTTPSHSINIEASLNQPATLSVTDKSQPTVLIFHTHTTESYEMLELGWYSTSYSTRSDNPARNMVRVGDAICSELEKQGIGYIHETQIFDSQYTGAYDRSREAILKILAQNPSIQIVLDVHRDAIYQSDGTRVKPAAKINNKKAAQVMIIAGCEDGKVSSFPSWEQNLTFALQLHKKAETMYPGLMRPILFSARKYNMDVIPCSVLLEIGSDSNTLAEAEYSGHLIGKAIAGFVNDNVAK